MAKTLKQIADEIGVSKQRVYRFVKQGNVSEAFQDGNTKYYDESAENFIKSSFTSDETFHEALHETKKEDAVLNDAILETLGHSEKIIETLVIMKQQIENYQTELEEKDKIIEQQITYQTNIYSKELEAMKQQEKMSHILQSTLDIMQTAHQKELESRDKRIEQLQTEISQLRADIGQLRADLSAAWQRNDEISGKLIQLTDQAQKLQLMQMQPPALPVPEEEMPDKKQGFWKRIFGKKE